MVETLADKLLDFFSPALPQLLASSDSKEVVELVTLLNQLVLKFKAPIAVSVGQVNPTES